MGPRLRKLALTAHVASSVGWLGGVAAVLMLGVLGLTSESSQTVRGVYLVMEPAGRWLLIPLALASLLTGLIQSLGTTWGLFRHYWVVFKLLINLVASIVLVMYMDTFSTMAATAADPGAALNAVRNPSPLIHAAAALLLLLIATALSVYKPKGMTRHGQRKQESQRPPQR